ncbi:MAG: ATP-binding cassette domain-containing protein, partial [bacterium]|nr:ATP-binding cassette domain-containing protein [bacterium]
PTAGCYRLQGQDVSQLSGGEQARVRNTRIGFVFQSFNLLPRMSALENVTLPLLYQGRVKQARERAAKALERVGLVERIAHRPTELSGGERQRVAIARALVLEPRAVLFDEPLTHLDVALRRELLEVFRRLLAERGATALYVTHDPREAASLGDRIAVLEGGEITCAGSWADLAAAPATAFLSALREEMAPSGVESPERR